MTDVSGTGRFHHRPTPWKDLCGVFRVVGCPEANGFTPLRPGDLTLAG